MTGRAKDEARALSREEAALVEEAEAAGPGGPGDEALAGLIDRLRERRDRARDIADRQRREARGKAAPAGAAPAGGDEGTRLKARMLGEALARAEAERARRSEEAANPEQAALARRALAMKKERAEDAPRPETREADEGFRSIPNEEIAPSGALDAEGYKPVLERSRKVR